MTRRTPGTFARLSAIDSAADRAGKTRINKQFVLADPAITAAVGRVRLLPYLAVCVCLAFPFANAAASFHGLNCCCRRLLKMSKGIERVLFETIATTRCWLTLHIHL